jgi:hypothetical protein
VKWVTAFGFPFVEVPGISDDWGQSVVREKYEGAEIMKSRLAFLAMLVGTIRRRS